MTLGDCPSYSSSNTQHRQSSLVADSQCPDFIEQSNCPTSVTTKDISGSTPESLANLDDWVFAGGQIETTIGAPEMWDHVIWDYFFLNISPFLVLNYTQNHNSFDHWRMFLSGCEPACRAIFAVSLLSLKAVDIYDRGHEYHRDQAEQKMNKFPSEELLHKEDAEGLLATTVMLLYYEVNFPGLSF